MRCVNLLERPDGGSIAISSEPIFSGGRIIEQGQPVDVLDHPQERRTAAYVANYSALA